jgi:putative flippase GtrA
MFYALVGAVGTAVHYAVFVALLHGGVAVLGASTVGYLFGAVVNYVLNYKLTFRSTRTHREAALRFFTVAAFGLVLNVVIVALVMLASPPPIVAQLVATGVCLLATYGLNSVWSFGRAPETAPPAESI